MAASQKGAAAAGMDVVAMQILKQYGLASKSRLSFDEFLMLFTDQAHWPTGAQDYLANVGLDFKGTIPLSSILIVPNFCFNETKTKKVNFWLHHGIRKVTTTSKSFYF